MQIINSIKNLYQKQNPLFVKVVFPLILFLYPFLTVNQGVDVSDSTYSLSNYLFFDRIEGMWAVSTYLSNVAGWLLTRLPFGNTLLGIKIYSTLIISGTVLLAYYQLKKWMPAWIVFVGEAAAIGFLWIPAGILYNYLTYFFFTMGALYLYRGLVEEKDIWLHRAGWALGMNLFVRIPNLTETALILALWYYLCSRRCKMGVIVKKTLWCLWGYLTVVIILLLAVIGSYKVSGIREMIAGLTGLQGNDESYSLLTMITGVIDAYTRTFKWMLVIVLGMAMGMAMFFLLKDRFVWGQKALYLAGLAVLLRFLWGRGMFSFRYYEDYTSMYEWGMVALYLCIIAAVYMLLSRTCTLEEKLLACISLIIVVITPLGSNNYTFQNLNNLFFVLPFTLYTYVKLYRRRLSPRGIAVRVAFPVKAMVMMLGVMILIQSAGFHSQFVFRDGMDGQKREYLFTEPKSLRGMKTTRENGENLQRVLSCLAEKNREKQELILFGDCPGLSFMTGTPAALGSSWPDLPSYPYDSFVSDIEELEEPPVVVIRNVSTGGDSAVRKKEYLTAFLGRNQYINIYNDGTYAVYKTQNETLQ